MRVSASQSDAGVIFEIKVAAGSRVAGLRGIKDGLLKVCVTVAPEKGKANKAVLRLLAKQLNVSQSSLSIVRGATSSRKQILTTSLSIEELHLRIIAMLD